MCFFVLTLSLKKNRPSFLFFISLFFSSSFPFLQRGVPLSAAHRPWLVWFCFCLVFAARGRCMDESQGAKNAACSPRGKNGKRRKDSAESLFLQRNIATSHCHTVCYQEQKCLLVRTPYSVLRPEYGRQIPKSNPAWAYSLVLLG